MLAMHLSPREIAVAVVAVVMLGHVTTGKVVVVVVDGVESVGMVTTRTLVGDPVVCLHVAEGLLVLEVLLTTLRQRRAGVGQFVVRIQESLAVSTRDGTDGGVHAETGGAERSGRR